jgi:hypothetical protein
MNVGGTQNCHPNHRTRTLVSKEHKFGYKALTSMKQITRVQDHGTKNRNEKNQERRKT